MLNACFEGTISFDPSGVSNNLKAIGQADVFIQKLDNNGNLLWFKQMGGVDYNYGSAIVTDIKGNVFTTGAFLGTTDFDPGTGVANLTSNGAQDIFIQKLNQTTIVGLEENTFQEKLNVYPNPTHGNFAIEFENIQQNISVRLLSITGQVIESKEFLNTNIFQMGIHQPNGVYLVEVSNKLGKRVVVRMIKE